MDELDLSGPMPILVKHGGTMRPLIAHWLGLMPEQTAGIGFPSHVTSITVLTIGWHGLPELERLNDIAHLDGMEGYVPLGMLA
jgi:broad specificity phosphatase PhoE